MSIPTKRRDDNDATGTPRWVKIAGVTAIVVALVIVVLMLVGGGDHGPGRHGTGAPVSTEAPAAA